VPELDGKFAAAVVGKPLVMSKASRQPVAEAPNAHFDVTPV